MSIVYKTLAWGTLGANLGNNPASDLTINLASGHGARFSSMLATANDYTWLTIVDLADVNKPIERVKVVGPVVGDALTIPSGGRAQDGTTIRSFNASGSPPPRVEFRLCKPVLDEFVTAKDLATMADYKASSVGGTGDAITAVHPFPLSAIVGTGAAPTDGMTSVFTPTAPNSSSAPTYTPDGLTTKTIKGPGGTPLPPGALAPAKKAKLVFSSDLDGWELMSPMFGGAVPGSMMHWPSMTCPAWALVRDGSAVSRTTYARLMDVLAPTTTGNTTNASNAVTSIPSTVGMYVGMPIEGTNIPASTTVASITSSSAITISNNATGSGTGVTIRPFPYGNGNGSTTYNLPDDREVFERGWGATARGYDTSEIVGTTTSSANTVTGLASTVGLFVGMAVTSAAGGIPGSTTIASITSATAITISNNATASGARTLTFTGRRFGSEQADEFKLHTHTSAFTTPGGGGVSYNGNGSANPLNPNGSTGGPETRPKNRAYLPIIVH